MKTEVERLRELLLDQGHRLWSSAISEAAARPFDTNTTYHRMKAPRVGDVVFVYLASPRTDPRLRLGVLRELRPGSQFTIEAFDGELVDWEDAQVLRLFEPTDPR